MTSIRTGVLLQYYLRPIIGWDFLILGSVNVLKTGKKRGSSFHVAVPKRKMPLDFLRREISDLRTYYSFTFIVEHTPCSL